MEPNVTEPQNWSVKMLVPEMEWLWSTTVLLVPTVVLLTAGVFYLYSLVLGLISKTSVRNKVVLLSDVLTGLGKECASLFHRGGARLVLCGRDWDGLEELSEELSHASDPAVTFPVKLVLLDFGDMDSLPEAVEEVLECYGCLDVLILNSSMKVKAPAHSVSLEIDKLLMDNNYFGPVTLTKAVLPTMMSRRTGHILLINSIQAKLPVPFRSTYAASKHAVQAFFDCLRSEVEEFGITVSSINHTFISSTATGEQRRPLWNWLYSQKPLGVSVDEVATEIVKTLHNRRREVLIAPSLPKMAVYARSFFPNVFFAVMAAGVKDAAAAAENLQ
ncbi:dehydrogenase/reductase SDR family member 7C-B isoform X1 [Eucyclogobius newberryi]|uniref:dehydrogenase/reductase SDR family member 7C-B isoform X1 n=2 Tax=Eucyclogobius newberryi TaxID=166745 RepID=UPI003B5CD3DF